MSDALDKLLDLLDLEQIEVNIFRGRSPDETVQRVYGGQVAGQALVAAGRTVPDDRPVHSLHAYFIRPGDPTVPLIYSVDRIRDGRSFTTRRVTATQHGKAIFALSASFQHPEPGPEFALPMPAAPSPELLRPNSERVAEAIGVTLPAHVRESPIDVRSVGPMSIEVAIDPSLRPAADNLVWLRVNGELPDDPLLHVCLMTYASDLTLLDTVLLDLGLSWHNGTAVGGEPGPRDVVPPAVPGRPVAAVRPGVNIRLGRARPGPGRGVHRRRRSGRLRRPRGPHPHHSEVQLLSAHADQSTQGKKSLTRREIPGQKCVALL